MVSQFSTFLIVPISSNFATWMEGVLAIIGLERWRFSEQSTSLHWVFMPIIFFFRIVESSLRSNPNLSPYCTRRSSIFWYNIRSLLFFLSRFLLFRIGAGLPQFLPLVS